MIDLIKEIEDLKDIKYGWDYDLAIDDCLKRINQYNIIAAPKTIKLSEIVSRLQETMKGKLLIEDGMWCEKAIGYYVRTWEDYDFDELVGFDKEMKIIHIALDTNKYKWLYTLWIAGTTIIDDLEDKDEQH